MTGNESEPAKDPDKTVFDPDNVFGADSGDGESSPDSAREADNIWGPFTGDVAPDHSTQVLESDAFGRPFLPEGSNDPFGASDPAAGDLSLWSPGGDGDAGSHGDGPDSGQWSPPGFGDQPAEPATHMEHEVPPPWEFESGGPPGPWSPNPAGDQQQPWQPAADNGQQPWQPQQPQGGFDPFSGGQQPDAPFGQDGQFGAPAGDSPFGQGSQFGTPPGGGPGDSPFGQGDQFGTPPGDSPFGQGDQFGTPPGDGAGDSPFGQGDQFGTPPGDSPFGQGSQFGTPAPGDSPFGQGDQPGGPGDSPFGQGGPFAPDGGGQRPDAPWAPGGPGDSPFGQGGPFASDAGDQPGGVPSFTAGQPGTEVPNPFAAPDSAPSPFDSAQFGDRDAPQPSTDQPQGDSAAGDGEPNPFFPQQSDDEHSTDVLPRPSGGGPGAFDQPWPPQGDQGQAPASPWGQWPGDPGQQQPPQPPQQQQAPRYDLSQFQQGYQPPQQPPPPPQQNQQFGFQGLPQQGQQVPPQQGGPQFQQYPGMAPPLQLPPQQPIPLTSENLSPQALLRPRKAPPTSGWRRAVFKVSGGLIDPGESSKEVQRQQMVSLVRTPVAGGHYRVAVLSLKGGVGKTTTTVGLGSTLASLRGDRIIAVDANPDRGTLSEKVRLETRANVRDMLANKDGIQRYSDVRQYTSQAASRLEVLASDPDPAISEAFSEGDYRSIADVLEHYYSICLTDCGTGLLHSAMRGVLGLADQIVLVSSASVDGARSASATLDWLDAHDYSDLVQSGVVVMSAVRPQNKAVDLSRLEQHFSARCRALVRIPFDPHLEAGAEFVLEQLSAPTRDAYLELTAAVAAGFQYRLPS